VLCIMDLVFRWLKIWVMKPRKCLRVNHIVNQEGYNFFGLSVSWWNYTPSPSAARLPWTLWRLDLPRCAPIGESAWTQDFFLEVRKEDIAGESGKFTFRTACCNSWSPWDGRWLVTMWSIDSKVQSLCGQ
jgi:hypothetical protein